jgi:alpha-tubulin suppressor-like RCC1 family protein
MVGAGVLFSIVLTSTNELFAFGTNAGGELGTGETSDFKKLPVAVNMTNILPYGQIIALSVGDDHSAVLTDQGAMFAWGNNEFSQLPVGKSVTHLLLPTRVPTDEFITSIACSSYNTLYLTQSGKIYVYGYYGSAQISAQVNIPGVVNTSMIPSAELSSAVLYGGKNYSAILTP